MLSCKQASALLSQSLERRLRFTERCALWFHLSICASCRRFKQQLLQITRAVNKLIQRTEQDETITLSQQARRRIEHSFNSTNSTLGE